MRQRRAWHSFFHTPHNAHWQKECRINTGDRDFLMARNFCSAKCGLRVWLFFPMLFEHFSWFLDIIFFHYLWKRWLNNTDKVPVFKEKIHFSILVGYTLCATFGAYLAHLLLCIHLPVVGLVILMKADKNKDIATSTLVLNHFCDTSKFKSCYFAGLALMLEYESLRIQGTQDFSVWSKIQNRSAHFFLPSIIVVCMSDFTLQSLLNGLMCYKPDDPIEYLESCLQKVKELGGAEKVKWDTFVSPEKKTLPPLNGGQSRRSFFRNGKELSMNTLTFAVLWKILHPLLSYFLLTFIADQASFWSSFGEGLSILFAWVLAFGFLSSHNGFCAREKVVIILQPDEGCLLCKYLTH